MKKLSAVSVAVFTYLASPAWSQALPPAGDVNKDAQQSPAAREINPANVSPLPTPRTSEAGGGKVLVKGFAFSGNTALSEPELQSLVAPYVNQELDIAGFDQAADAVSQRYRALGYAIARAFVPAQKSADGIVTMTVLEGRFGKVDLKNESAINDALLQKIANANLDQLIKNSGLERSILLLKDLPGVTATASLKPGSASGTSDLALEVSNTKLRAYSMGFDNFGSPSTGTSRLNATADYNNLRGEGDQLNLNVATTTMGNTVTGGATYAVPVGNSGQRAGASFTRSQYRLGAGFSSTQSYGLSNALSAFTVYPLVRSVASSLYLRASGEVRNGINTVGAANTSFRSNASVARFGMNGDKLDGFAGGGFTSYGATLSLGSTSTTDPNDATPTGANSAGSFSKINYNLARQQTLSGPFTVYGSFSAQKANKNLDGSEQTGLGGPTSVRGYGGEAGGSSGGLATAELRYTTPIKLSNDVSSITYAMFVDRGWVQFYQTPPTATPAGTPNSRTLGSYGLTVTLSSQPKVPTATSTGYFARAMYGMHSAAQASVVDPSSTRKFWLQAGINF